MKILKKTLSLFSVLLGILFYIPTAFAVENWEITSFHSDIEIQQNGDTIITETINADFTNEAHRGIARVIPYEYDNGSFDKYNAKIDFISATDDTGTPWANTVYKENGYLNIEMRTPDNSLTNGQKTFIVKYSANNVIGFFQDHDEFYWNVNGTDWVVPIKTVTADIHLPKEIPAENLQLDCFTGTYGEKNKDCEWKIIDPQTVSFTSTKPLAPYENLSAVLGMPVGTIPPPSLSEKIIEFLKVYWGLLLPLVVLVLMFAFWYKKGRDEKTIKDTVIPHYKAPDGLIPLETGTIIDEKLDSRDITSVIIDLAVRGFIKIKETETDYELELIKPFETLKKGEKIIFDNIFSKNEAGEITKISDLKNKFFKCIPETEKAVMKDLVTAGYFPMSPSAIRKTYLIIGLTIAFIGGYSFNAISPFTAFGILVSGIIILIIGRFMPRKTKKGAETYYQLKGLHEYINTAEKDRMKFQEDNGIIFEKLLPYAMAFGLITKWATAFEGILKTPPVWFVGVHPWGPHFSMTNFGNSLNGMGTKFTSNIYSRPGGRGGAWGRGSGLSGGGFSGGGFGGGGGHGL